MSPLVLPAILLVKGIACIVIGVRRARKELKEKEDERTK